MPITQWLILNIPTGILGLIIVGGAVVMPALGFLVMRRFFPHHARLKEHHDVAGPVLGVLGAVYAVLLAFIVVTVWQNLDRTNANVQQEANYLADIYRNAEAFAPGFQEKVGAVVREYRGAVVADEWKTMARGEMSPRVEAIMNKLWRTYTSYEPASLKEQAFFEEAVEKLNSFRELRRQRLMDSRNGIHSMLWWVLILGAIVTVSIMFFFGVENLKVHAVMIVLLSLIIALCLYTIMLLDFPFTGDISVSPEPFLRLILN